jgi:enoyl-CoA hydratase
LSNSFDFENILVDTSSLGESRMATITLNRPKVLNALNTQTLREIVAALKELEKNHAVVVLTGNDKAFAAGADIKQMLEARPSDQINDDREKLWKEFCSYPYPIVAAVNGFCLGGGHELAMACDLMIAGDNAKFGQPEINIGTTPGAGGTQRFTRTIGKAKASYYALTGEMFGADKALQMGLVAKVVPYRTTVVEAKLCASKMAKKSPMALRLIKEGINSAFNTTLDEGLKLERRNFYLTFSLEDQKEGMKAFLEKRQPNYKGN